MLQTKNLTKIYKKKRTETIALDNVNIDFGDKGLIFVVGKSGSGKSTLLNLLGGLIRPTGGDVIIDGQSSVAFKDGKLDSYRNTAVGFVFQEYNLFDSYTVGANVKLALELQGKKADRQAVDEILRKVELCDEDGKTYYDRLVNELSGGQRQRVAIARALVKDPRIILADEPTGALDSETGATIFQLFRDISQERLVIVVSHDKKSAEKFADRIIELSDGKVVSDSKENYHSVSADTVKENKYIASKLPVKYALATSISSLKTNPLRLVLSVILSVLCLIIFGFLLMASFSGELKTELKTMHAEGYTMLVIRSGKMGQEVYDSALQDNGIKGVNSYFAHFGVYDLPIGADKTKRYNNPYKVLADGGSLWFAELNPDTGEDFAKLTPDSRFIDKNLCRLPREYDEIAITDIKADMFIKYGYVTDDGQRIKINTPDDLIGKTVPAEGSKQSKTSAYKICGVYSTEQSADYFRQYDIDNYGLTNKEIENGERYKLKKSEEYYFGSAGTSIITFTFVCEGFFSYNYNVYPSGTLVSLTGNFNKDYTALKNINKSLEGNIELVSGVSRFLYPLHLWEELKPYTSAAACGIGAFALLIMLNFLIASVGDRNKEMGILRSLGAGKKSIIFICIVESLILACINFVLSVAGTAVVSAIVNAIYYVKAFNVGIETVSSLFAISVVFSSLTTAILSLIVTHKKN